MSLLSSRTITDNYSSSVRRWIAGGELDREPEQPPQYVPCPPVPNKLEPYKPIIHSYTSGLDPALTGVRLLEEIRAAGYDDGYSQLREYVRQLRPRSPAAPVVRFETPAGQQAQVDFAEFRFPWGKRYALLVVLAYPRILWLRFYPRKDMATLFSGLEEADEGRLRRLRRFTALRPTFACWAANSPSATAAVCRPPCAVAGFRLSRPSWTSTSPSSPPLIGSRSSLSTSSDSWSGGRTSSCSGRQASGKPTSRSASPSRRRFYYGTLGDLITSLEEAQAGGHLQQRLKVLRYRSLLVVDEVGYLPITRTGSILFFQLIARRCETASTVITSNKGFEDWGTIFGDEVMAAVLIDRLLHHCHVVSICGNSYRLKNQRGLWRLPETADRSTEPNSLYDLITIDATTGA